MDKFSSPQHDIQKPRLLQIAERFRSQRNFERPVQAVVHRIFQIGCEDEIDAVFASLCINLLEEFITTQNKMIAAQIFIAKGSSSMLQATIITARFVKMHRTYIPRIPCGFLLSTPSYWYGHNFPLD